MNSSSWDAACFDGGGCDGGAAGRLRELDLFIGELGSAKREMERCESEGLSVRGNKIPATSCRYLESVLRFSRLRVT